MVLVHLVRGICGTSMLDFLLRFIITQGKEGRLPLRCLWLGSLLIVFLKEKSESFMITENSRIGQVASTKQVVIRFMFSGTNVMSSN